MTAIADIAAVVLTGACLLAAIPVVFLAVQIASTLLPARRSAGAAASSDRPRVAVLMPAHDEEASVARSIGSILPQLGLADRLLVVADNCTDATAEVARRAGAEVTLRQDAARIGKGYALAHGFSALAADPPDILIVVDADCEVGPGSLVLIANRCRAAGRPIQARYVMLPPLAPSAADKISQLAWTLKTFVRPLGSDRLGWPCQLMGSGMALPYDALRQFELATGHLAEDQKLGADFALAGLAPRFCPDAVVTSRLPQGDRGKRQQRTRWEHGHLAVIADFLRPLVRHSVRIRSASLLAFTLDLCIPPLTMLAMSLILLHLTCFAALACLGIAGPLMLSTALLVGLVTAVAVAWWRFAQQIISWRELVAGPGYCLLKLPSYARFVLGRRIGWIRTER